MKKTIIIITAVLLALLMSAVMPAQIFADSLPEYISEVKIGMGKTPSDAEAALSGYTILSAENGGYVNLNQKAGGDLGSKGEKAVYLGYKTTTNRKEAITDLALMNMKGGYSVQDYEALMETQLKSQIAPFVDNFLSAIEEYRENYNSSLESNKARAEYIHGILNNFTDDDCGGKGLGDLLLNETKYEMGLKAFNALSDADKENTDVIKESEKAFEKLSDEEKKNHADILTILAQTNGKVTLMIENLITRASDTNEDTWIDRFSATTYDDLEEMMDMLPTDAGAELAKLYDDDAKKVLALWDDFSENLSGYDAAVKFLKSYNPDEYTDACEAYENIDKNSKEEESLEVLNEFDKAVKNYNRFMDDTRTVLIHDALDGIEYGEGTLLDFFMTPYDEISEDIRQLYPLVASLSDGQRAGLEFVNLMEFCCLAITDENGYSDVELDKIEKASIYAGVDRDIYKKGGVALTSEALRGKALQQDEDEESVNKLAVIFLAAGFASLVGLIGSIAGWAYNANMFNRVNTIFNTTGVNPVYKVIKTDLGGGFINEEYVYSVDVYAARTTLCKFLTAGFTIVMVAAYAVGLYLSYKEMVDTYKVEFTPIPNYMVDEADITAYNEKGEKIVIKNQSAYYKAVQCNRTEKDEFYGTLGTCADLNGDVGKQWLALYAAKNEAMKPILASSLKVVVGNTDIPAGYETGIHMFGSSSAFNLNSELYDWNKSAPSVFVYFKTDSAAAASTSGSNFTAGNLAIAGGAGLVLGAVISALAVSAAGKKKSKKAVA